MLAACLLNSSSSFECQLSRAQGQIHAYVPPPLLLGWKTHTTGVCGALVQTQASGQGRRDARLRGWGACTLTLPQRRRTAPWPAALVKQSAYLIKTLLATITMIELGTKP